MNTLLTFRKRAGASQQAVAVLAGVSQVCVSQIEKNDADVSLRRARRIVSALKTLGVDATLDEVFPPDFEESSKAA